MEFRGVTALVTGASGGLGRELVNGLLARGAKRVYAADLSEADAGDPRVVPLRIDVTDRDCVHAAADAAADTTLLINNAGVIAFRSPTDDDAVERARFEVEVNYLGALAMANRFAPVIEGNGGGMIVNVASITALVATAAIGTYCASKAATWQMTNALRLALAGSRVRVSSALLGFTDTPLIEALDVAKSAPATIAGVMLDGITQEEYEILCDERSRYVKANLSNDIREFYEPQLTRPMA